jgi:hypothetical protein
MQEELPGMPAPITARKKAPVAHKPEWSGPIPGQTVMDPRSLGRLSYGVDANDYAMGATRPESRHAEIDKHGFVSQVHDVSQQFDSVDLDRSSGDLYVSLGGSRSKEKSVREHWDKQPMARVKADSPLHTTQATIDTEKVGDIDSIRQSIAAGNDIKNPVWLMRDKGKLFVLDGHHRITAARKEGLADFPARIWDRDAETGWKP